jgi:hypothetical protein
MRAGARTRGERAIVWIGRYCVRPAGPERGHPVRLTAPEREIVRRIYDDAVSAPIGGELAAYIALLHLVGIEGRMREDPPAPLSADLFTTWNSAGPRLRAYVRRDGEALVCVALGTRWDPDGRRQREQLGRRPPASAPAARGRGARRDHGRGPT